MRAFMVWLSDLMAGASDGNIASESLEIRDQGIILCMLLSPHDQEGQGMLVAAWKPAIVNTDVCQCTLELVTKKLHLNLLVVADNFMESVSSHQDPMDQQIALKVDLNGPLPGLEEWAKGEICSQ